jgi:hypothetical protein
MLERSVHKAARKSTVELLAKALSLDETEINLLATAARFETCLEPTTAAVPYELRTPLTPLIGRDIEVAHACRLLRSESARVVTVTGAPGVGKTRLALEVATRLARDFPNGVVKVSLGHLSHPEMLALAIRRALGLSDRGRRPPLETVLAHCRELELLLLLDNFEHLLASASLLLDLTVACPRLRFSSPAAPHSESVASTSCRCLPSTCLVLTRVPPSTWKPSAECRLCDYSLIVLRQLHRASW